MEVVPVREKFMFKQLKRSGERKAVLDTKWEDGLWLGHARASNDFVIGTRDGVVRAWAIKRKLEGERWDKELITNMTGTPSRPNPQTQGADIPIRVNLP